jgi:ribosome maturation factor RimP
MINKYEIERLVKECLEDGTFLVDITVSSSNVIHVFLDSFDGLNIDDCAKVSRYIELKLDREEEDFELQVSSPGLSRPFKVKEQFIKNIGREVEIMTNSGIGIRGVLKDAGSEKVVLESYSREKVEGHKKKQLIVRNYDLGYDEIKSAKVIVTFK